MGGGKVGIDGFLLITGYYMCEKEISIRKWFGLVIEIVFYNATINAVFLLIRYEASSRAELWKGFFSANILRGLEPGSDSFIVYYLLLYLLIPYINRAITGIDKRMHLRLIIILLTVYTVVPTFSMGIINSFSALGCYIMIYVIGAYCKRFEFVLDSAYRGGQGLVISLALLFAYILASDYLWIKKGVELVGGVYNPINGICKVFAVSISLSLFFIFKNIEIVYNRIINVVASTTLGVLCIHANSYTMRRFLWKSIMKVPNSQQLPITIFISRSIGIPLLVFAVCVGIDLIRQLIFSWFIGQIRGHSIS